MDRTACTEPQCLYKGDLYLYFYRIYWPVQPLFVPKERNSFEGNELEHEISRTESALVHCCRHFTESTQTPFTVKCSRHQQLGRVSNSVLTQCKCFSVSIHRYPHNPGAICKHVEKGAWVWRHNILQGSTTHQILIRQKGFQAVH